MRSHRMLDDDTLQALVEHEEQLVSDSDTTSRVILSCTKYAKSRALEAHLRSTADENGFHPVLFSRAADRACFISHSTQPVVSQSADFSSVIVPHAMKIDDTVHWTADQITRGSVGTDYVVEIALGVGVMGKGIVDKSMHELTSQSMFTRLRALQSNSAMREQHAENFFWTSTRSMQRLDVGHEDRKSLRDSVRYRRSMQKRYSAAMHLNCDFSAAEVVSLQSHISVSISATASHSPECMLQLASVASMLPGVSHVSAHTREISLESSSEYYVNASAPTDQNAYVQSGSSLATPYADINLDGSGYILGMIDSGLDDLSCFLIDYSGTPTTRTPADEYANPITEYYRRKVIQYVAWADGEPALHGYDHGTWCGGASVGKCNDTDNAAASAYNGLASNAQITMFDVDANDNFLNVPSLYNIALPPAYSAGARVHSNSWGTPGINTYTTKALDVDQFMYENTDFLFVVAAGNDGRTGYTSVHSPGVSKNALTVGASAAAPNHDMVVYFSSIGYNYDQHMIKPNIVTPGTSLMSAGVRNENETTSCNVQDSSGTSMATPMAAGAAILIRQYFENTSYWASFCDPSYRSCPAVVDGEGISGALLKAAMIHSGEGMTGAMTSSTSVLPATNLTTPPDRYQGWGQVQLTNLLPIPGVVDLDLYVADYETLQSLTQRTYVVDVTSSATPLRATIVWIDPVNVMWSTKNLLNDLDLIVTSPLGNVTYGNNIKGDEFNPVERVVIEEPMVGQWSVEVVANSLAVGDNQKYSIVITSGGSVQETETNINPIPVSTDDVLVDDETETCMRKQHSGESAFQLVRFQLEDWDAGNSWRGLYFTVLHSDGSEAFNCTFIQNNVTDNSVDNRVYQCAACLEEDETYTAYLDTSAAFKNQAQYIKVSSQCSGVFLSKQQEQMAMTLSNGKCNACPEGSTELQALMYANVTDDDSADYTWYGQAYYTVTDSDDTVVAAGTLLVSDEQADRYCLPEGLYTLSLYDDELYTNRLKHAKVVFSAANSSSVTLTGTSSETKFDLGGVDVNKNDDDDDLTKSTEFIVGISVAAAVLCLVCTAVSWWTIKRRKESASARENLLP
eukprot:CAMPEP_0185025224 /NCGR_PEP_ID=MMETSP1103-20130426/8265_1 /TAXON_ID=36769 /ORGANISM="Paraphysomonas bandaiensis, Strain Caron Lab Isolate" /LENGTH=1079 /DNA_ID=CAMNT_0027558375 /DNA_START=206 /DNA_END=3445 /DNA_ORIENTATION=-